MQAAVTADVQPVVPAHRQWANGLLGQGVVNRKPTIFQVTNQGRPLVRRVADRFADLTLGQDPRDLGR
jgi:hypothetical protein